MSNYDERALTAAYTNPLLTRTGAETVFDTTVSLQFSVKGKQATKAAVVDGVTPTLDAQTGKAFVALKTGEKCVFVWGYTDAGVVKVAQGKIVKTADVVNESKSLEFPGIPDTMAPFAYHTAAHADATNWTFGTSNWNATGLTLGAVIPVSQLPSQPLTS